MRVTRKRHQGTTIRVLGGLLSLATVAIFLWVTVPYHRTLSRPVLLVAAALPLALSVVTAVMMVSIRKAIVRLREHGLTADATIIEVEERYVAIPGGYNGWVTKITVSFTDAEGEPVRARYIDHFPAGGRHEGQSMQIVYDPEAPASVSPAGRSSRPEDPRYFELIILTFVVLGCVWASIDFACRAIG